MCPTRLQKVFQGQMKGFSWCGRYKYPKSDAKLNLSYQVWSHGGFAFKKKGHLTDIFPVLQKLTHMSKLQSIFVPISKIIFQNANKIHLYKLQNAFVQIAKCICPNYKMYLSKLKKRESVHFVYKGSIPHWVFKQTYKNVTNVKKKNGKRCKK